MNNAKRAFVVGMWGRSGAAMPLAACNGGGCRQGDFPELCDCELACDIAPDAERVIQAPALTAEDHAAIARIRRWTLVVVAAGFALLGALLGISDARWVS